MAEEADAAVAEAAAAAELDDDLPAEEEWVVVAVLGAEVVLAGDETGVALPLHQRVMSYESYVIFGQYLVWQLKNSKIRKVFFFLFLFLFFPKEKGEGLNKPFINRDRGAEAGVVCKGAVVIG